MILVDTGPLVAAANRTDTHHDESVRALSSVPPPRLVPGLVIAEVTYLLARDASAAVEGVPPILFRRVPRTGRPTVEDLARTADLVEQYSDLPLGTTDACLVTIAERLGITELVTLDRRHFSVVRPSHVPALTLLP